jgi:hypothetical protein
VNVGACGFAVALPYFFQNSMFAIFVLYFDLSQDIVILERIITRKYLEQNNVTFCTFI